MWLHQFWNTIFKAKAIQYTGPVFPWPKAMKHPFKCSNLYIKHHVYEAVTTFYQPEYLPACLFVMPLMHGFTFQRFCTKDVNSRSRAYVVPQTGKKSFSQKSTIWLISKRGLKRVVELWCTSLREPIVLQSSKQALSIPQGVY